MTSRTATIASPCIGLCQLDEQDICIGCYRSVTEIIEWASLNPEQKLQVLANTEIRQQQRLGPSSD